MAVKPCSDVKDAALAADMIVNTAQAIFREFRVRCHIRSAMPR